MNKVAMKDTIYYMLAVRIDSLVEIGKEYGFTWEDFEQMLHDSMKDYEIPTEEEGDE